MEDVEEYYNKRAKIYDDVFGILYFKLYDVITWKYLEPYVPTDSNSLVFDAGGGTGRWAVRMAEKGCKVHLMDASEEMLKMATSRTKKQCLQDRIIVQKGNIAKTNYPNETFDLVFCEHTLFLFKEPDVLMKELVRILKKKSKLVISCHNRYVTSLARLPDRPNIESVDNAFKLLTGEKRQYMTEDEKVEIFTWTPTEFRRMLERNCLRVEKVVGKGFTMPLRISQEFYMKRQYPKALFDKIAEFELSLCEKPDALALAGHMQVIATKQ